MIDEKNNPADLDEDAAENIGTDAAEAAAEEKTPAFDIENSTVFSAPEKKGVKDASKRDRKGLKRILALVLVLVVAGALTGGWFLFRRLVPEDEGGTSSIGSGEIELFKGSKNDVESLVIEESGNSLKLFSKVTKTESTSSDNASSELTADDITWYVDGVDPELTDSSNISYTVGDACEVTASREMTGDADYGLEKPRKTITLKMRDSEKPGYELSVGNVSPDKKGYYCRISSAPEKVYLIEASKIELFDVEATEFGRKTLVETVTADDTGDGYFESDTLTKFDSITVTGTDSTVRLVKNPDGNYNQFLVASPKRRYADDTAVSELLKPLTEGLSADSVICFGADQASLAKYGLDKPACTAEYAIGKYSLKLRVSAADSEGSAAIVVGDSPKAIYKITASELPFFNIKADSLYTKYLFFEDIKSISGVKIENKDGAYTFALTHNDTDDSDTNLTVTCNGKEISTPDFRTFYQHLLTVSVNSFTDEKAAGGNVASVSVDFLDKSQKTLNVTYAEFTDMRYHATRNGEPYGIVTSAGVDQLFKDAEKLVNGVSLE